MLSENTKGKLRKASSLVDMGAYIAGKAKYVNPNNIINKSKSVKYVLGKSPKLLAKDMIEEAIEQAAKNPQRKFREVSLGYSQLNKVKPKSNFSKVISDKLNLIRDNTKKTLRGARMYKDELIQAGNRPSNSAEVLGVLGTTGGVYALNRHWGNDTDSSLRNALIAGAISTRPGRRIAINAAKGLGKLGRKQKVLAGAGVLGSGYYLYKQPEIMKGIRETDSGILYRKETAADRFKRKLNESQAYVDELRRNGEIIR